ncbi:MAG: 3-hydroxyacyl-CoA dehydrogenase family protein [Erysipelotrichaceae bacterium]
MNINTVTVLGANGTMGRNVAGIFASFGNAKVFMMCRDIEKAKNAVIDSYESIKSESIKDNLIPCTYDDLADCISQSDLVFESLYEDFDIKTNMYNKIVPFLKKNAIVATGTSGLSIKKLAEIFNDKSDLFFGIHMFNPPYNLTLCELIVHDNKQETLSKELSDYLRDNLKRTVVRVKDSPSFLGNRIGFYFINEAINLAFENKDHGGIDYIDSILGCFTGRAMAPLATADFVGLDITKSIVDYIYDETNDCFKQSFKLSNFLIKLVEENKLGRKVNCGFYKFDKDTKSKLVYDIKQDNYRNINHYEFYFSNEMIKNIGVGNYKKAFDILLNDESREACICKSMLLKYVLYSLKIAYDVADNIADCDDAMATGFSWIPPIALIELLGGIINVQNLTKKYLDNNFIDLAFDQNILDKLPNCCIYDFRSFLKAKY